MLSFALESAVDLIITSPAGILWSSVLRPALAIWLLRNELGLSTPASESIAPNVNSAAAPANGMNNVRIIIDDNDAGNAAVATVLQPSDVALVETNTHKRLQGGVPRFINHMLLCAGCTEPSDSSSEDGQDVGDG